MRIPGIFKVAVLSAAISSAIAVGFGATRSVLDAYEAAASISSVLSKHQQWDLPERNRDLDLSGLSPTFIYAVILGPGLTPNPRHNPWAAIQPALAGYDYRKRAGNLPSDAMHTLIIRMPDAIWELHPLIRLLDKHSFLYVIQDGSGLIHAGNTRRGMSKGYLPIA